MRAAARSRTPRQEPLPLPAAWGGRRPGAGRKPKGAKAGVPHRARPWYDRAHPVHLTLRAVSTLPNLREARREALIRGVQGLAVRLAHAINRRLRRRGRVFADRYHARPLTTPREVRNALVYVLNNARKHGQVMRQVDLCSSAPWFAGWAERLPPVGLRRLEAPTAEARTWLLATGWRRWGPLALDEAPRSPG